MKKIPTKLKQLAEHRARLRADGERLCEAYDELHNDILVLEGQIDLLREKQRNLQSFISQNSRETFAVDEKIRHNFPQVKPEEITPTFGFRQEYGKRGRLIGSILELVSLSGSKGITSKELSKELCSKFGLEFTIAQQKRDWTKNSLYPAIRNLREKGVIKSIGKISNRQIWVLAERSPSFEELLALSHEVSD